MIDVTKPLIFFSRRFFLLSKTDARKARKKGSDDRQTKADSVVKPKNNY
jgi:hypothetical protein